MSDIFISYSRKDLKDVTLIVESLEALGYDVWWDVDDLKGGEVFAKIIQAEISNSKCVIVVWSSHSIKSDWVHSEATLGDSQKKLITVNFFETQAPLPFNNRHNEKLFFSNGKLSNESIEKLITAISPYCELYPSSNLVNVSSGGEIVNEEKQETYISPLDKKPCDGSSSSVEVVKKIISRKSELSNLDMIQELIEKNSKIITIASIPSILFCVFLIYRIFNNLPTHEALVTNNNDFIGIFELKNDLNLLKVDAGSFNMGSEYGSSDEQPVHEVVIKEPLWMSSTEITIEQFGLFAEETDFVMPKDENWEGISKKHPVVNISWHDAQDYTTWLSENNPYDLKCRLPSESEWEYAARAKKNSNINQKYSWGNVASHEYANYGEDSQWRGHEAGKDIWFYTAPVGKFPPNAFGLYDLHGNVFEWVQDTWHKNYIGAPSGGKAREEAALSSRVVRGGSWYSTPDDIRSAARFKHPATRKFSGIGFRVVCLPNKGNKTS